MELVYDSDVSIKAASIQLIFNISHLFPPECMKNRLINLFQEVLCTFNEELTKKISLFLEEALVKIEPFVNKSANFLSIAVKSFKSFGTHKNDEIRRNFAKSVVQIVKTLEPKTFLEHFKSIYCALLVNEKNKDIRIVCVGNFADVLGLVGPLSAHHCFKQIFIKFLKDEDKDFLKVFLTNFGKILEKFIITSTDPVILLNSEDTRLVLFKKFFILMF